MTAARLRLAHVTKRFGAVVANEDVALTVQPGEIHAVLGENGAGKSTLMKIVYGALRPDEGEISWDGQPVQVRSPHEARALGIAMVFQHFSLFDSLTVAENVWLGMDGKVSLEEVARGIQAKAAEYGLDLDPSKPVHVLSVGERQRVEIVRALLANPRLLILDEPTSVLTPQAVEKLFVTLRKLAATGCSILYISHKLDEIRSLCHACTVLRGGKVVGTCDPTRETTGSLSRLMIGAEPPVLVHRPPRPGQVALTVNDLRLERWDRYSVLIEGISLEVREGEVVGIAGISGNGQQELLAALSGEDTRPTPGMVRMFGAPIGRKGPEARRKLGLHFVPEERLGRGAVPAFSLANNMLLTRREALRFGGWIDRTFLGDQTRGILGRFAVKASGPGAVAKSLSGGNLQKYIVGREIDAIPKVLVVAQPTWGVDVGASAQIRAELIALRDAGCAVLVVSEELEELFEISDRLHVIARGRLSPSIDTPKATVELIGEWMSGLWPGNERVAEGGGVIRLEARPAPSRLWSVLSPIAALLITIGVAAVLFAALGKDPARGLEVFLLKPWSGVRALTELGLKATPLILCALGLALAFRANVWNIGAEGQFLVGGIVGGGLALLVTTSQVAIDRWLFFPLLVLAGAVGGMIWASIAAFLKDRFNANEILVSLMLVYVADLFLSWLVFGPWKDPGGFNFPQTVNFASGTNVPRVIPGMRLHWGFGLAILGALGMWIFMFRTYRGMQLLVGGPAPAAARYAGFSARIALWSTFLISGALAGVAGALEVAGPMGQLTPHVSQGYGFAAIIVAFVGRLHPLGAVVASLVLATFSIGGELAQSRLGLPAAITGVFQGVLLLALLGCDTLILYRPRWTAR